MKVYDWLIDLDARLSTMADEGRTQEEWAVFHDSKFDEAGNEIDKAVSKLAADMKLYVGNSHIKL